MHHIKLHLISSYHHTISIHIMSHCIMHSISHQTISHYVMLASASGYIISDSITHYEPLHTQKRRPASITKGYTAAALFFLSHRASESTRVTFTRACMKLHVTTRIHGRKHLYNASVYGDIYRYICGGLGVVISQLPPRRVHTCKCEM